jgi:hypothetical protein
VVCDAQWAAEFSQASDEFFSNKRRYGFVFFTGEMLLREMNEFLYDSAGAGI